MVVNVVNTVPATAGAMADPKFLKTVFKPVAAPSLYLGTENVRRFMSETLRRAKPRKPKDI